MKTKILPSSTRAHRQQNWVGICTNQWELRESTKEPSFLLLEAHVATTVLATLAPVSTVLRRTPSAPIALFLADPQWRIFRCRLLLALLRSYTSLTRDDKSAVKVLRWQKQQYQSEAYVLKANVLRSCFHWMRPCSDCIGSRTGYLAGWILVLAASLEGRTSNLTRSVRIGLLILSSCLSAGSK